MNSIKKQEEKKEVLERHYNDSAEIMHELRVSCTYSGITYYKVPLFLNPCGCHALVLAYDS